MKKYLEEGWDPVIKSDVDGENALPLRIDAENKHFGRISATRRAARTVYMGSAARPDGSRGVDIKSVVLGCAQPGEPAGQFGRRAQPPLGPGHPPLRRRRAVLVLAPAQRHPCGRGSRGVELHRPRRRRRGRSADSARSRSACSSDPRVRRRARRCRRRRRGRATCRARPLGHALSRTTQLDRCGPGHQDPRPTRRRPAAQSKPACVHRRSRQPAGRTSSRDSDASRLEVDRATTTRPST